MTSRFARVASILVLCGLYIYSLGGMGMVTPDEPRYADIGRAMAHTGDWVMPRLFGVPWFEKPALLYWLVGAGNLTGLDSEWAPRIPIAIVSIGFILLFWHRVRISRDEATAWYSSVILATSAGWLAYSHVAVTDLPLAACFGSAVLLSLPWVETGDRKLLPYAAAALAFAALAKGMVPLALFCPVLLFRWRNARDWLVPALIFCVIALPWYVAVSIQSHGEFLRVFFVEHTFGRFQNAAMQHVQPWWFYLPVIALLLFPWFPFLAILRVCDSRSRVLLAVVGFGFVLFSISVNKLPGYLLPLLPALAILLGESFAGTTRWKPVVVATSTLCGLLPLAGNVLPQALAHGLKNVDISWGWAWYVLLGFALGMVNSYKTKPIAFAGLTVFLAFGLFWLEDSAFPAIDQAASARPIWLKTHPDCIGKVSRTVFYGLPYYAGHALPDCSFLDRGAPRVVR